MALSANTVWELRTAGASTNGGGFVTGATGTDYSQQNGNNVATGNDDSTTDAVAAGTTTITSATANFGTTIVGNIIYLQGGTGALAAGRYQVITRASATNITVDRNVAAGTGITMNIGGAINGIGVCSASYVAGNIVYIKAGTYTISSATIGAVGGTFSSVGNTYIEGYNATRGDLGTAPLMQASGISAFTVFIAGGGGSTIVNVNMDGAGLGTSRGINTGGTVYKCKAENFTNNAFTTSSTSTCYFCEATGCSTNEPYDQVNAVACIAHDNTVTGYAIGAGCFFFNCISESNSGASSDGVAFSASATRSACVNCVAYNNGRDGFRCDGDAVFVINCIAEDNAGWGFNDLNQASLLFDCCAGFSNTSGEITIGTGKVTRSIDFVTGSSSFFTDAANGDFSLNNTAGAGADARAAGKPGPYLNALTTGYLDIGAAQHQDTGGGGGGEGGAGYFG
jgi:hypothetical protein